MSCYPGLGNLCLAAVSGLGLLQDALLNLGGAVEGGPASESGAAEVSTVEVGYTLGLDSVYSAAEVLVKRNAGELLAGLGGVLLGLERKGDLLVSKSKVQGLGVGKSRELVRTNVGEVALLSRETNFVLVTTTALLALGGVEVVHTTPDKLVADGHYCTERPRMVT